MAAISTWSLEADAHRVRFAAVPGLAVYGESAGATTGTHRCPAWKLVVALDGARLSYEGPPGGHVDLGRGVHLLRAQETHACGTDGPFVCLFADRWMWPEPGDARRDAADVAAVRVAVDRWVWEGTGWSRLLAALVDWNGPLAPRTPVGRALEELRRTDDLATPARWLGQSSGHVRRRVVAEVGCPPSGVRRWMRLVRGYAAVGGASVAAAAGTAGYADQAHFTRESGLLAGRTPGSVARR